MNTNIFERLKKVKALALDVDGVLTDGAILVTDDGQQLRQFNIKDGYALKKAADTGLPIIIISGGTSESVRLRLQRLGITNIHLGVSEKLDVLQTWLAQKGLDGADLLYMGDDIPDLGCMKFAGLAACPKDAAEELIQCAHYVSSKKGGQGAVRDVLEKLLKLQGKWLD